MLTADAIGATYQWLDCDKGNSPISGKTTRSFTPTLPGNYAVEVTENNCKTTSNCYLVKWDNIGAISNTNFNIIPNPSAGDASIIFTNSLQDANFKVVNITGKTILEKSNIFGLKIDFNLSDYSNGIYFIEVTQNGTTSRGKLVKNQ
jgi:hypothetical protein